MKASKKLQELGGNPKGFVGRLTGALMNAGHTPIYRVMLKSLLFKEDADALDIGCGGGKWLRALSKKTSGRICGVDHSEEMAEMATRINRRTRVEITQACVTKLPYEDDSFDIATAYETIQFWPDIPMGLSEIKRVLRPEGRIIIVNRFPDEGSKWTEFLQLISAADYTDALQQAGFHETRFDTGLLLGWITAHGTK